VEVKDRAKDIIVSGGENISTVEVEAALFRHPKVRGPARVRTGARGVFGSSSFAFPVTFLGMLPVYPNAPVGLCDSMLQVGP
jgi:acyl-CoA synthetase (AMP-forming)/AMP-acid ligase II